LPKPHEPTLQPKLCQRACKTNALKEIVLKNLPTLKKIKNADTRANTERQESKMIMTEKLNIDNGLQGQTKIHQAVTGVCCQWRDCASYDSEVINKTFVLRRKFSGKIATEQQPPIRCVQPTVDSSTSTRRRKPKAE